MRSKPEDQGARTVEGLVTVAGTATNAIGPFTCARTNTGQFRITPLAPFRSVSSMTATPNPAGVIADSVVIANNGDGSFAVTIWSIGSAPAGVDHNFSIRIVGR